MSLLHLPEDVLTDIVSRLNRVDRNSLRKVHPELRYILRPGNTSLWRGALQRRIPAHRSQPPFWLSPFSQCELFDIANDYFIHHTLPTQHVLRPVPSSPPSNAPLLFRTNLPAAPLHVAVSNKLHSFCTRSWRACSTQALQSRATCIHADHNAVAVGLLDGHVHMSYSDSQSTIRAHDRPVTSVMHYANMLISASEDITVRIRRTVLPCSQTELRGHAAPVRSMHMLHGDKLVTNGSLDHRVKLWDLQHSKCLSTAFFGDTVSHCVHYNELVYAMSANTIFVLDHRVGFGSIVATLTLPPKDSWQAPVGALSVADDGSLVAAVGSGGVAVWDARGKWEAHGFGWPDRWGCEPSYLLRSAYIGQCVVIAGGGTTELLTFARNGCYEGIIAEKGVRLSPISFVGLVDDTLLVASDNGALDRACVKDAEVNWKAVYNVQEQEILRNDPSMDTLARIPTRNKCKSKGPITL